MEEMLTRAGLSHGQAQAYLLLLDRGSDTPPEIAKALKLTRSNAYKVLDRLVAIGLAQRTKAGKKFIYEAGDPALLAELVGEARNHAIAVEHAVKTAMDVLHKKYSKKTAATVETRRGKDAVIALYEHQAHLKQPIFFIKSPADITYMGYETLDQLRRLPASLGSQRYGITPDNAAAPLTPEIDQRTNLHRTWVAEDEYRAPVEWSASGGELNIYVFDKETYAIRIENRVIAEAFESLWRLLDKSLRLRPGYNELPVRANREV